MEALTMSRANGHEHDSRPRPARPRIACGRAALFLIPRKRARPALSLSTRYPHPSLSLTQQAEPTHNKTAFNAKLDEIMTELQVKRGRVGSARSSSCAGLHPSRASSSQPCCCFCCSTPPTHAHTYINPTFHTTGHQAGAQEPGRRRHHPEGESPDK